MPLWKKSATTPRKWRKQKENGATQTDCTATYIRLSFRAPPKGIVFFREGEKIFHEIYTPDGKISFSWELPYNYSGNYFHFICSYDRKDNELCYYYDFNLAADWYSPLPVSQDLEIASDETLIGNNSSFTVDDIILFNHKLSDPEIENLKNYYEQQ